MGVCAAFAWTYQFVAASGLDLDCFCGTSDPLRSPAQLSDDRTWGRSRRRFRCFLERIAVIDLKILENIRIRIRTVLNKIKSKGFKAIN